MVYASLIYILIIRSVYTEGGFSATDMRLGNLANTKIRFLIILHGESEESTTNAA